MKALMSEISRTKEPRTAPPEARRKQLIEATITAISKHGIAGTTLTKVTQEAGLSLGLANFHFDSKDALLTATLQHLADEHRALWIDKSRQPDLSAAAKLQAIVNAQFHPKVCNRRKLSVWFAFFGDTPHRSAYLRTSGELDRERQRVTADLCARIIGERGYTIVSPNQVSHMLEGLFDGLWLNILMYPDLFDRNTARDQVNAYLAQCLKEDFL
ncbi:TetR/AcrR family transcriptional regulator [Aestuariicoccus sp. MJ-SS9]|uniref:TetR/AcrR family transcriptional regulator n=1 Tax=Aestuariicoccus sp. MJ-SS9 TaxID=3079855 RepID=UPI00290619FB|nr:TetR family transcriptional regulator C-terminal domain-containing protein [Aestuariicoccus sp. MJ-SS9]MDU8914116.1 TetR family transcriptional regulator C-terminal domain-containing protein [Aestuariicoccus sp. MJ-SS9]